MQTLTVEKIVIAIFGIIILIVLTVLLPGSFVSALFALAGSIVGTLLVTASQERDRHNALRLAAVDKRLSAHQDAYDLWRKLLINSSEDELYSLVRECDQ